MDNVTKYYIRKALPASGFVLPVLTTRILRNGLSYTELGVVGSVFTASWLLGEIPTGYIGDRIGRRNSMIAADGCLALAMIGFGLSSSFLGFAGSYLLWGVSTAFGSGAAGAWLYDTLERQLDSEAYAHVSGRGMGIALAATAVGSLVGGWLASVRPWAPFAVAAVVAVCSGLTVLTFDNSRGGAGEHTNLTVAETLPLLRDQLSDAKVGPVIIYLVLVVGFFETVIGYVQPVGLELGIDTAAFGVIYAVFRLAQAAVSFNVERIRDRIGLHRWMRLGPFVAAAAFLSVAVEPVLAIGVFLLSQMAYVITTPLQRQYLNDQFDSERRATLLSVVSMATSLGGIGLGIAAGVAADVVGPIRFVAGFGGVYLIVLPAVRLGFARLSTPVFESNPATE